MYQGDFKTNSTVDIYFSTNAATGGAVAPSTAFEAADVLIYKDHSSTQRSSTAGITMTSPFDSVTGLHQLSIDTSENTDAGFWAAGHDYFCVLSPDTETVDSQVVVSVIGSFSLENRVLGASGLDAILMSDIAAVPGITASLKAALNWLFVLARNKRTQTSTTETVFKDDSSTSVATSTKSDDGTTFIRGKLT